MTIKPPNPPSPTERCEQYSIVNLSDIIGNLFFYAPKATGSFDNAISNTLLNDELLSDTPTHRRNLYLYLSIIVSKYFDSMDLWGWLFDSNFKKSFHSKNDFEFVLSSNHRDEYRRILMDIGIIGYSSGYSVGSKSKRYWVNCSLNDFKLVTLNQLGLPDFPPERTNKLLCYFNNLNDFYSVTDTERFLWGNLFKITVVPEAFQFIIDDANKPKKDQLFPPSKAKSKCNKCDKRFAWSKRACPKCGSRDFTQYPDVDQRAIATRKLERMNTKRFKFRAASLKHDIESDDFFIDEKIQCRRIFTSVTSTKRELRQFLRYDGKALCEVDIHASQPLIASNLYHTRKQVFRIGLPPNDVPPIGIGEGPIPADIEERRKWLGLYPSDNDGDFYENFAALAGAKINRETVKALLVKECFNALNPYSKDGIRLKKQFVKHFPILNQRIDEVKGAVEYREGKHPDCSVTNGRFGVEMQNLEADIMINGVCEEIRTDHGFFTTPIHDAVMVEAENVEWTRLIIEKHTDRVIGVKPKLSVKNHGAKKLLTQSEQHSSWPRNPPPQPKKD